jgi:hypothetical protein
VDKYKAESVIKKYFEPQIIKNGYSAVHGLPDGSGKHGEALCVGLVPDLQRTAGTTADEGYMAESPKSKTTKS